MEIKDNQALTPEKKQILIDQLNQEISMLASSIKERKYGDALYLVLQKTKDGLQETLNKLLDKKGIVTPNETKMTLEQLSESKRNRLQGDYIMGIKRSTFYLATIVIIGVASYIIIKNKK